jgi:hypothetical protein
MAGDVLVAFLTHVQVERNATNFLQVHNRHHQQGIHEISGQYVVHAQVERNAIIVIHVFFSSTPKIPPIRPHG